MMVEIKQSSAIKIFYLVQVNLTRIVEPYLNRQSSLIGQFCLTKPKPQLMLDLIYSLLNMAKSKLHPLFTSFIYLNLSERFHL